MMPFPFLMSLLICSSLSAAEYRIGVRAKSGVEYAYSQWQATVDLLNEGIPEHHFTLMPIVKLDEITATAGRGGFEFVLTNPSTHAEIEMLHGVHRSAGADDRSWQD